MKQEITTSGGTYVVTFTQAGTVEADRNNRTYILATATGEGQVAFKAISDSVIISDDAAILTAEDFVFAPGPILKPTSPTPSTSDTLTITREADGLTYNINYPEDEDFSEVKFANFGAGLGKYNYKLYINTGGATSLKNMLNACAAELADVTAPEALDISAICQNSPYLKNIKITAEKATTARDIITNDISFQNVEIHAPSATNIGNSFCSAARFKSLKINLASAQTVNINPPSSYNATGWTDFEVDTGGLASCRTFKIYNVHAALTDEAIQNAVDALPDWSGTGTTALAQFPAGRLTEAQQSALATKGWTWSEATD